MLGSDVETRTTAHVQVRVEHDAGRAAGLLAAVPEYPWAMTVQPDDDGGWRVRVESRGETEGHEERRQSWAAALDSVPETVDGVPVRAEVHELVDRDGEVGAGKRGSARQRVVAQLQDMEERFGAEAIVALLSEEAGKRGFVLHKDRDIEAEVDEQVITPSDGRDPRDPV